ncbi:protease modulator HflC [Paremcibacter congregatus]|uniref:protease modulator HflC n=1 Tax=Paremcibacter congregatus TaxID=2043170 RepID=UPI0030EF135A
MNNMKTLIALIVVGISVVVLGASVFTVKETEQALILEFGKWKRTVTMPGLHFKTPFVQDVVYFDKRILLLDTPELIVITEDQKRIIVDAFTEFRVDDPLKVYQAVRNVPGAESRLSTILNSNLRKVFGQQAFKTALSGERKDLRKSISDSVKSEAEELGIKVVDVRIKRTDLPAENSKSIFNSMIAERNQVAREIRARGEEMAIRIKSKADRDKVVILAEAEREAQKLRGDGDAEAARIFANAYNQDPEFYGFYRSMIAYRQAFAKDNTTMVLSPTSDFFKYFGDLKGLKK